MPKKISEQDNFSYLLLSLLFLLLGSAVASQFLRANTQYTIIAMIVVSMFIGIWSVHSRKRAFHTGLGLVAAMLVVSLSARLLNVQKLDVVTLLLLLSFFLLTLKYAAQQILKPGRISGNQLYGSVCVYLLLGLVWSVLYLLLIEFQPGSFYGVPEGTSILNFTGMTYFSFVTLTTLGFGEILPVTPLARFLVYMEAVAGILYIAIFVSSLIGLRITHEMKRSE
jgi:voltage-gated potassium channel